MAVTLSAASAVCGLGGAAALLLSAFKPWYEGQDPRTVRVTELLAGMDPGGAAPLAVSGFAPLAGAAVLGVAAVFFGLRPLLAFAGLAGLATGVLWVIQQARDVAPVAFEVTDLQAGVWFAGGGALLLLLASGLPLTTRR